MQTRPRRGWRTLRDFSASTWRDSGSSKVRSGTQSCAFFLATRGHLSTEELHRLVKEHDATIGYTTVYRALKLFAECGLAAEVEFHDGVIRYEHRLNRRNHHHMVCTVCGDSVEFFSPEVEAIEHSIGEQFGYATTRHSFQIYGTCHACQIKQKEKSSAS